MQFSVVAGFHSSSNGERGPPPRRGVTRDSCETLDCAVTKMTKGAKRLTQGGSVHQGEEEQLAGQRGRELPRGRNLGQSAQVWRTQFPAE